MPSRVQGLHPPLTLAPGNFPNLAFPGSELVWEQLVDEGVGHGFDLWNKSALVGRLYCVEADPANIQAWYRNQLVSKGWAPGGGHLGRPPRGLSGVSELEMLDNSTPRCRAGAV